MSAVSSKAMTTPEPRVAPIARVASNVNGVSSASGPTKTPAAPPSSTALRSRPPAIPRAFAVAGRSLLPQERWPEMSLDRVYTLAEYTDQDSSKDPELSAALLRRIGQDIAAGLR